RLPRHWHVLSMHCCPAEHLMPQPPQLSTSDVVSPQLPPVSGLAHPVRNRALARQNEATSEGMANDSRCMRAFSCRGIGRLGSKVPGAGARNAVEDTPKLCAATRHFTPARRAAQIGNGPHVSACAPWCSKARNLHQLGSLDSDLDSCTIARPASPRG